MPRQASWRKVSNCPDELRACLPGALGATVRSRLGAVQLEPKRIPIQSASLFRLIGTFDCRPQHANRCRGRENHILHHEPELLREWAGRGKLRARLVKLGGLPQDIENSSIFYQKGVDE